MLTVDFARSETPTTCSFGVTSEVGLLRRLARSPHEPVDRLELALDDVVVRHGTAPARW